MAPPAVQMIGVAEPETFVGSDQPTAVPLEFTLHVGMHDSLVEKGAWYLVPVVSWMQIYNSSKSLVTLFDLSHAPSAPEKLVNRALFPWLDVC